MYTCSFSVTRHRTGSQKSIRPAVHSEIIRFRGGVMRTFRFIVFCVFSFMIVLTSRSAFAQRATGSVNGTVTDPTGSVVVDANATLTNQDTNVVSHATTNRSGYFVFLDVAPGPYLLKISKEGFKGVELPTFQLLVNQTLTENVALSVGSTTEIVKVNAEQEGVMLQNSSSEL